MVGARSVAPPALSQLIHGILHAKVLAFDWLMCEESFPGQPFLGADEPSGRHVSVD